MTEDDYDDSCLRFSPKQWSLIVFFHVFSIILILMVVQSCTTPYITELGEDWTTKWYIFYGSFPVIKIMTMMEFPSLESLVLLGCLSLNSGQKSSPITRLGQKLVRPTNPREPKQQFWAPYLQTPLKGDPTSRPHKTSPWTPQKIEPLHASVVTKLHDPAGFEVTRLPDVNKNPCCNKPPSCQLVSFPGLLVVVGEQKGSGVASYSIALRSHDEGFRH